MSASTQEKFSFGEIECSSHTVAQLLDELRVLLGDKSRSPRTILCVNAHIYNLAARDAELRHRLNVASICAADGMAIVWAARCFGVRMGGRCNMTDAFKAFLAASTMPRASAVLVGCTLAEANGAAKKINASAPHCHIVAVCSGFSSDAEYRTFFAENARAEMILIGMGTPKSERIVELAAQTCPGAVVWHIGAGTIRILAGTMSEAPSAWRRLGLQWLHRLIGDPGRLWQRYLLGNPIFVGRVLLAGICGRIGRSD